jgi:hypothetical protein
MYTHKIFTLDKHQAICSAFFHSVYVFFYICNTNSVASPHHVKQFQTVHLQLNATVPQSNELNQLHAACSSPRTTENSS